MHDDTVVELEGVNGEWFTLAGPDAGDRGMHLGTGVKGLFDPPIKVVYEEPGNYPGARFLNYRVLRRDITLAILILDDKSDPWAGRDSELRKALAFDRDAFLYVTTPESGRRKLAVRLGDAPDVDLETDPHLGQIVVVKLLLIAGDPFWYEDDVVYSAVTEEDTTFDPSSYSYPWPYDALPKETLTITVHPSDGKGGLNPTDQTIFLKWTVPGSTEAPSAPYVPGIPWLGAPASPATIWVVPDYSFEDEELANRRLRMPGLIGGLRTNEVQKIYIDGRPTGGTFTLGFGVETTGTIAYNASASSVKSALEALTAIGSGDVDVVQEVATNERQTIQVTGGPTGGTYTLTLDGQTTAGIPFSANARLVKAALEALSNVAFNDVSVSEEVTNEVQRIEVAGEPTGGTFTLTFDGQTTAAIPYNATNLQVASALKALSNIGNSDINVIGEKLFLWGPYKVTFQGALAGNNVAQITANPGGLTGGTGTTVNVTTVAAGSRVITVDFRNALGGFNLPTMTANAAGLTGGSSPGVTIATAQDGSRPWVVTFKGNLSGVDVDEMTIDTTALTGGTTPTGRIATTTEGDTAPAENAFIDTDPRVEQVTSQSGSALWARMNGVRFRHPVPPYTESKEFELTATGCVPGQMVTLRIPRPWSRPWGLE